MQHLINLINNANKGVRSSYHLTLGKLIAFLKINKDLPIVANISGSFVGLSKLSSYRGYYTDLAIEPSQIICRSKELLTILTEVLNEPLEGYKGGLFLMTEDTPLWVSAYGDASNNAVIDVTVKDHKIVLITKVIE